LQIVSRASGVEEMVPIYCKKWSLPTLLTWEYWYNWRQCSCQTERNDSCDHDTSRTVLPILFPVPSIRTTTTFQYLAYTFCPVECKKYELIFGLNLDSLRKSLAMLLSNLLHLQTIWNQND
jgi:hypothetical protein